MEINEFVSRVPAFGTLSHSERIKHFGWYLHFVKGRERFDREAIKQCYVALHAEVPDIGTYLNRLVDRKPREVLKDAQGYRLEGSTREALTKKYGDLESTIVVGRLLSDLPARVPDLGEKVFLQETISCYKVKAFRAAIVMAWNLAFHHLMSWLVNDAARLAKFNAQTPKVYQNNRKLIPITSYEDFEKYREAELIEIAASAGIISSTMKKILKEKLDRRNTAAHPSVAVVTEAQANDVITDLVNNVVLVLK